MERLLSLRSLQRPLSGIAMGCLLLLVLPVTVKASSLATSAAMGYVYGFPIVLMGETLDGMTGPERSCSLGADINTFKHVYEIPDERFKAVVRPNVDTLYSSGGQRL